MYPRVQVYRASDLSGSAVPAYRRCRPRVNTEQEPGDCAVQVAPPPVSSRDRQEASSVGRFYRAFGWAGQRSQKTLFIHPEQYFSLTPIN